MHGTLFSVTYVFCRKPATVEWRYTEEGEKVRVSARTGRIIPLPNQAEETYDYKIKAAYQGENFLSKN